MFNSLSRVVCGLVAGAIFGFVSPYLLFLYLDATGVDVVAHRLRSYLFNYHVDLFYPALTAVVGSWFWLAIRLKTFRRENYYLSKRLNGLESFYHSKAVFSPVVVPIMALPFVILVISHLLIPVLPMRADQALMYGGTIFGRWDDYLNDAVAISGLVLICIWSYLFHLMVRSMGYYGRLFMAVGVYFMFAASHTYLVTLYFDSFYWFLSEFSPSRF